LADDRLEQRAAKTPFSTRAADAWRTYEDRSVANE
jgi:hypothetical protein